MDQSVRDNLLSIYQAALERVSGEKVVRDYLRQHVLEGRYRLVAIGKAASSMSLGALNEIGDVLEAGLVITKHGHLDASLQAYPHIRGIESDHPLPGEASLAAGAALVRFIEDSPDDARFLFLISGGASSLVEVLPQGFGLDQLQKLTEAMLASGMTINEMNRVRRSISLIKGGGLVGYLTNRYALGLFISDVPDNDPAVIGSGLLSGTEDKMGELLLPAEVQQYLRGVPPVSAPSREAFRNIETHVVATLEDAKLAAAHRASQIGNYVALHCDMLGGDATTTAQHICRQLLYSKPSIHIWGGETTVHLPPTPGRGGRNQHFALVAAQLLRGRDDVCLLAAGTDGTDGPTEDAGALIDGETVLRGELAGLDVEACLEAANAGEFLEASGDLIHTGPSGTNVMDLVVAVRQES